MLVRHAVLLLVCLLVTSVAQAEAPAPPEGFRVVFNGQDLAGWHGESTMDPRALANLESADRSAKLAEWQTDAVAHWTVEHGELVNDGFGVYLTTDESYQNYEFLIDYKTIPTADSGIYLKSNPQVQIWNHKAEKLSDGQDKGSGGLWNNTKGAPGKDPFVIADRPFGEWNSFRIKQVGTRTTVHLNDQLLVDNAIMENYWDPARNVPLVPRGPVQLQTHGGEIRWRNIYVREIKQEEATQFLVGKEEGFTPIFDGKSLAGWKGAVDNYEIVDGSIRCKEGKGGVLHTEKEFGDFVARLEFKLPAGGNNGLAIRYPGEGDPAYTGMCELQVLDTEHEQYKSLDPRQAHGSAYGMIAAHRGYHCPTGQWNYQEITVKGSTLKVELNGNVILNGDLATVKEVMANSPHPGKERTSGFFGFSGHGDAVEFRNVRVKELK